jgi:hypothetical protein
MNFDDTEGPDPQIEAQWPTVSSPAEYLRHRIRLRVHSRSRYTVVGSGIVSRRTAAAVQTWVLDSCRPIPSSVMFFAAVPVRTFATRRFSVAGVPVTIASDRSPEVTRRAVRVTRRTISRMVEELGPFPMPRMQILLTGWDSGMEYYGATRTGMSALRHELVHMYIGTTTLAGTWRDTWLDEAAVEWYLGRDRLRRLPRGFSSDMARGRSTVAPGFDETAYGLGARVFGEIARSMGGTRPMVDFLAGLHRRRAFHPFTTDDFIDDVVRAQDRLSRARLERWLYAKP